MVVVEEKTNSGINMAEKLKKNGNDLFVKAEYEPAIGLYEQALTHISSSTNPKEFSIIKSNISCCYLKMEQWEKAVENATAAIEAGPANEKPLHRRAQAYEKLQKFDLALADYKQIMEKNSEYSSQQKIPNKIPALEVLQREATEQLKEEMLGKLKDLGNFVLRPFGLSTDSFMMEDDGKGGMKVSMKKE